MEKQHTQFQQLAKASRMLREETLRKAGISSAVISQAVKAGALIRLSRGDYHHPETDLDEHLSRSEAAARVLQERLRNILLPKLISSELRLPEVEPVIEEALS